MNRIYFFSNLASKALIITKFNRLFSSALYITGDKAHKTYAVVTPILDFEERLKNKLELEENIKLRCLNIDLEAVEKRWVFYKHLNEQKENLEFTRSEIGKEITRLIKNENETQNVEKFKVHAKLVKEELKLLKDYLYGVEESSVLKVLSLPNILHPNTPKTSEETFYSFLEKPLTKSSSHMELGSDLILCLNPYLYYLKGDAAFFELSLTEFVRNALIDFSFIQFCTSDFSRSVVIEGCGTNFQNKLEVFTLEKIHTDSNHGEYNRLHLTGGASLYSFMAYFTRNLVLESYLPLKLFSCGRKYQPQNSQILDLFNSTQETAVEVFIATRDHDDLNLKFKELVEKIIDIYQTFECHFRLSYLPPNKLKTYESLRLSIQMYSCHLEKYVEVGHISICDDFLSKRLLFSYNSNKERKFPKIISATLIRVQPLLACLLEYGKFNKSNIHFNLENIQRK